MSQMLKGTGPLNAAQSGIEELYRLNTPTSASLMQRAARVMPGGNTRTTSFHPPYPVVMDHGDGAWLWDVDGRRYLDMFCNGLSLIHGNNYGPSKEAIRAVIDRGTAWSGASREQIAFAEFLCHRLQAIESLRFTNSGSEAGMMAIKMARKITGRPYVLKSIGAYHGSYPDLEAGLYGQGAIAGSTLVAPFNDFESYERLFAAHGNAIAAVIIEPVMVTGRVVPPKSGFLNALETLTRRCGALFILDDCLMLRLAVGGSSEKFDLQPDITVLGKFLGGGTPLGAFGASTKLMQLFDPTAPRCMFHGGSFNGNLIGCVAGQATLNDLTAARITRMDAVTGRIRDAVSARARELDLDVIVSGFGSVFGVAFAADTQRHEDDPSALGLSALFHLACLSEGIVMGPGGIVTVSTAHDDAACAYAINGFSSALQATGRYLRSLQ